MYGYTQHPTSSAVNQGLTGSGLISVIAGDYLQMFYMQNSGGVLAVVLTDKRTRMDAHYTDPAITTKGRVTLRFEGGN